MLKKIIFVFSCLLCLGLVAFAASVDKPQIKAVEWDDGNWTVYGTGLVHYDKLYYYFEGEKMQTKRSSDPDEIDLEEIEKYTNGQIHVKGEVFSGSETSNADSSKITVYKPIDFYISKVKGSFDTTGTYTVTLDMENRTEDDVKDLDIYINNKLISDDKITDDGDDITIEYDDYYKYNKLNVFIKDKNKYISGMSYSMDNKISNFKVVGIYKDDNQVKVEFSVRGQDGMEVYVDDKSISTTQFDFLGSNTIVYFDANASSMEHSVYIKMGHNTTKKVYINLSDYVKPTIKSLVLTQGNRKLYDNTIVGKNLEGDLEDIVITINGKEYNVRKQNYGYWYTKIENKYDYELEGLVGDEREEIEEDKNKEIKDLEDYLYDVEFGPNGDKVSFTQRFLRNTGDNNTIEIEIDDKASNTLTFIAEDNRNEQTYNSDGSTGDSKGNLKANFNSVDSGTGTNYENKDYKLGTLSLTEGLELDYAIDSISFDLILETEEELEYVPVQYVSLGDIRGYIFPGEGENKYKISFENIKLTDFKSKNYDLKIKLGDNYKQFNAKILPLTVDYYVIEGSNEMEIISADIVYENGLVFQNQFVYSPCFDIDSDYENCKELGYKSKSKYNWAIGTTEDSMELVKEEEVTKENDSTDDEEEDDSSSSELSIDDQAFVSLFMDKLDSYVDKKSNGIKNKKETLYTKIYLILKQGYAKMKEGRKKDIVRQIMLNCLSILKELKS